MEMKSGWLGKPTLSTRTTAQRFASLNLVLQAAPSMDSISTWRCRNFQISILALSIEAGALTGPLLLPFDAIDVRSNI
jgi:hypothetical protein